MKKKFQKIKKTQKRIVFADGEDENTLKAAIAFKNSKLGIPILVGKKEKVKEQLKNIGYSENFNIEIVNSNDKKERCDAFFLFSGASGQEVERSFKQRFAPKIPGND